VLTKFTHSTPKTKRLSRAA